ncbi:transposase [Streptomyces sp. NBC_00365]|uniref:transposase n=1 Tax=Streptomyces sp. NBC_00365 TaxID=2975726 RepID=UPI002252745C|nr:transposase [Streptomyces sp. NBC_00365]MCX5096360.1 transposase [Streptomyces sp. NBC_00365]
MSQRKPYPSDLSDARWALIEPMLTAWRKARLDRRPTAQPAKVDLRDVFNALLYINRTGIPWKYLPHDFPNHGTVYAYYAAWRDEGILAQLNYDLTGPARVKEGRKPQPTDSVIDTVGIQLLDQAKKTYPTISKSWVDTGFKNAVIEHGASLGIDVEVVNGNPGVRGFHVVKRRWVVERSIGWIMLHRRLARDYETLPASSEAMIHVASIDNLTKRITDETTSTWRGTY